MAPNPPPTPPLTPREVHRPRQLTCALTSQGFRDADKVEGVRTRGYQQYCGFRKIPYHLRFGIGVYPLRVRYLQVRVRCRKTRPAVYPWQTLSPGNSNTL